MVTTWTFWMILAAILAVAEIMTGTFYLLVLAVAAVAGAGASALDLSSSGQVAIAAITGAVGFALLYAFRPKQTRVAAESNADVNPDIGAVVQIASIENAERLKVRYRGADWSARMDGTLIPELGRDYVVTRVDGSTLILSIKE